MGLTHHRMRWTMVVSTSVAQCPERRELADCLRFIEHYVFELDMLLSCLATSRN